ncbi:MAG: twin-arginine translocation signal domain-containing protein, partial [Caldilineaceae bacterium SB0670_bin_27]|nr:twin-arginine translocation signal domain-containing protein [Caldilineaceae bacterium SB0670_bin_27]
MSDSIERKQEQRGSTLNRRDFLRSASALAGLGLLAACAPAAQPAGEMGSD